MNQCLPNPANFATNTLAYVLNISSNSNLGYNYANYSAGAQSFPNGTVFLSQLLPDNNPVNVTFLYVTNSIVLYALDLAIRLAFVILREVMFMIIISLPILAKLISSN